MKKVLFLTFTIFLAILSPYTIFANNSLPGTFEQLEERQLQPYFDLAIQSIDEYNALRTSTQDSSLTAEGIASPSKESVVRLTEMATSAPVKELLIKKIAYESTPLIAQNVTQNNLSTSSKIINWKIVDEILICTISSQIVFQYSDTRMSSILWEETQIAIQNPKNPVIVDWYTCNPEQFDATVRGTNLDLSKTENLLPNVDRIALADKIQEKLEIMKEIARADSARYEKIHSEPSQISEAPGLQTNSGITTTSIEFEDWMSPRIKAVQYAWQIIGNPTYMSNPIPAYLSPPYYDFSQLNNQYDCTNFISHCLVAGEFDLHIGTPSTDSCWFYMSLGNRSTSWSGVEYLRNYLVYNTTRNVSSSSPKYTYINELFLNPYTTPGGSNQAQQGDIIQIKYNEPTKPGYEEDVFKHSTIVTTVEDNIIYVASRTNPTQGSFNVRLSTKYPPAPNTTKGSGGCFYRLFKIAYPAGSGSPPIN